MPLLSMALSSRRPPPRRFWVLTRRAWIMRTIEHSREAIVATQERMKSLLPSADLTFAVESAEFNDPLYLVKMANAALDDAVRSRVLNVDVTALALIVAGREKNVKMSVMKTNNSARIYAIPRNHEPLA